MGKMTDVTLDGTRLEQLRQLAVTLASQIDEPEQNHSMAQLARQYRETIAEIEYLESSRSEETELDDLLA